MKNRLYIFCFIMITFKGYSQSNFVVSSSGTNATIDAAIDHAVNIWDTYLITSIPVKLHIEYLDLTSQGPLGITLPNGRKDFPSSPIQGVWYASCLANSIEGVELNIGEHDINVFMNSATNYYFGTDGNPSLNQYDFVSVLIHEIAHGLGVVSLSKVINNEGSFGTLQASDFAPLNTTFPFPNLDGRPTVWDNMIINNAGEFIVDTLLFPNNSMALKTEFESNALYFSGPVSTALNAGSNPRVFAPNNYDPGSSLSHLNESTFPPSSGNCMMTPFISSGEVNHYPGPLFLAILQDIGWQVNATTYLNEFNNQLHINCYPNPVVDQIFIDIKEPVSKVQIELFNSEGKTLIISNGNSNQLSMKMDKYSPGIYYIRVTSNNIKKVVPVIVK